MMNFTITPDPELLTATMTALTLLRPQRRHFFSVPNILSSKKQYNERKLLKCVIIIIDYLNTRDN